MYTRFLVPIDGSIHARNALKAAIELASPEKDSMVTIVHVAPPMDSDTATYEMAARLAGVQDFDTQAIENAIKEYIELHREKVAAALGDIIDSAPENVDMEIVILKGRPSEVLVNFVLEHEKEIDLVIMGRRGLGAIRSAIGSVSFSILHAVELPVLLVK